MFGLAGSITSRSFSGKDSWLGWGHTIGMEEGETYADNTELCGCMLTGTDPMTGDTMYCELPNGDEVVYYQLVPLYEEEIAYKIENGADAHPPKNLYHTHRFVLCILY